MKPQLTVCRHNSPTLCFHRKHTFFILIIPVVLLLFGVLGCSDKTDEIACSDRDGDGYTKSG